MKKNTILSIFTLALLILTISCQRKDSKLVPDDYRTWEKPAHDVLNYPIPGHTTHLRVIYINKIGEGVTTETKGGRVFYIYPKGTIIVKEIYSTLEPKKDEDPVSLAVMIKDPENKLSQKGWVWVTKDFQTKKETVIDYEVCVDCHENANEKHPYGDKNPNEEHRDYVYFPYRGK